MSARVCMCLRIKLRSLKRRIPVQRERLKLQDDHLLRNKITEVGREAAL